MSDDAPIDDTVTITGTAYDAHAGALIERDGERDVYVEDLPYWPAELRGRTVEVTGVLGSRRLGPEPAINDTGLVSHGMSGGERLVLREARWRVVD